ncbi:hypothetical protein NQ317_008394 [Molorchus minor]|uniref:Peptidase S1 domain-containing protein n=1 Tax=Molorchus minor TaxID=1323400 RepID=A0ABQ9K5Q7_9CUCU|nr:hypothetical protein NQ317_008394 [Molorchus minor]
MTNYCFFSDRVCGRPLGRQYLLQTAKIVGGYDVGYYKFPWYVALTRYNQVVCGGALIGPSTVITAAHCYKEYLDLSKRGYLRLELIYKVRLGIYNVCVSEDTQKEYNVEKVQVHDLYYTKKPYYDICLLTLSGDTSAYEPICLPARPLVEKPNDASVPGLGTLRYEGEMPCTVHEARILIYNDTVCYNMIQSTGNDPKSIKNAFCAGYLQGGIDTCQGDSGGPLQSLNEDGDYVLLGIVSFGFHCALPGYLGMYTDVTQYVDWIEEKSGLDAGVVGLIYKPPSVKPVTELTTTTKGTFRPPRRKQPHRPVRIIIYRNKKEKEKIRLVLRANKYDTLV